MGNKRLSIIIPLYNVEEYIERCILSIVTQSINNDSYELILVNDGSTDRSQSIINQLQKKHSSIKLIYKENEGLSSARNKGLDIASGDYIFFVDADDWISSNTLSKLLNTINTHPEDIILFKTAEVYPNKEVKAINFHLPESNKTLLVEDYICDYTILSAAWQGLFKRNLFSDHNIRMPKGFLAEDDDLVIKLFSVAETIYYLPIEVYNYYQRPQSISNSSDDKHNTRLIRYRIYIFGGLVKYSQSFTGERKIGLERKLNFISLDIIRLLIRKSQPRQTIKQHLTQLHDLGYFPLNKKTYSLKYKVFRILLSKLSIICFLASLKKSKKFF